MPKIILPLPNLMMWYESKETTLQTSSARAVYFSFETYEVLASESSGLNDLTLKDIKGLRIIFLSLGLQKQRLSVQRKNDISYLQKSCTHL